MKLIKMEINNFRSFFSPEKSSPIVFDQGINIIVGENNVGKSSILKCLDFLIGRYEVNVEDYYKNDQTNPISISATFSISKDEFMKVLEQASTESGTREKKKLHLQARIGDTTTVKFSIDQNPPTGKRPRIEFEDIRKYLSDSENGLSAEEKAELLILENRSVSFFNGRIGENLLVFNEIRKRPGGKYESHLVSLDGESVASVLLTLKNGDSQQRKKFERIKNEFNNLFPSLKLEIMNRPNENPIVMIEKEPIHHEVSISHIGAGIGEIIILLTHIVASKGMIFALDMPELQLHPHSQRILGRLLEEYSAENQFIIVTHSPTFINPRKLANIIVVRDDMGKAKVTQISADAFCEEDKCRIERVLDHYNKEFFFSRAILMVEGETEIGALPEFSRVLQKDFDVNGISLVRTGKHFGLFAKLANLLGFPYLVMCDKDAIMNIEGSITFGSVRVKTSPIFVNLSLANQLTENDKEKLLQLQSKIVRVDNRENYNDEDYDMLAEMAKNHNVVALPSDFEGVLAANGYDEFIEKAKELTTSKVTVGRIIAEEITKNSKKIPYELQSIIEEVTQLIKLT